MAKEIKRKVNRMMVVRIRLDLGGQSLVTPAMLEGEEPNKSILPYAVNLGFYSRISYQECIAIMIVESNGAASCFVHP